jgi:hypothetical protein
MPRLITATALAVAGGVHLAAFPDHWRDGATVGTFFVVVAVLQLAAAMLVLRGVDSHLRRVVVVGNLALIALWAWARTTEPVDLLGLTAVAAQLIACLAVSRLPRVQGRLPLGRPLGALVGVFLLVAIGGAQLPDHHHDDHVHEHAESHH